MTYQILHGNNLDVLPTIADNSIDAIVTDPPYELGFMGKKWDSSGIAYSVELWRECLRVLKPGGHLLSFGGTRTWHRIAVAIEDAGFEVRDSIAWMYGSGFPKSLDVSKAIDKAAGVEYQAKPASGVGFMNSTDDGYNTTLNQLERVGESTPEAQQWEGWGTALKPAHEPIVVARKPLIGTVAENVLEYGTGGLNIDGSRIGTGLGGWNGLTSDRSNSEWESSGLKQTGESRPTLGRWPSNVILGHTELCQPTGKTIKNKTIAGKRTATFGTQETQSGGDGSGGWAGYEYETEVYECADGCPVKLLDEQSGVSKSPQPSTAINYGAGTDTSGNAILGKGLSASIPNVAPYGDKGGASRFFYVAKASKRDRNEGLEELPLKKSDQRSDVAAGLWAEMEAPKQNFHPTVKPTALMRYLVKLVTPPGGVVLDPFTGSGSTGKAAILEGFDFIGIEMTDEYLPIIEGRLKHAEKLAAEEEQKKEEALF